MVSFARNDAGVESGEVPAKVKAGVFDLETPVLDDSEAGVACRGGCCIMAQSELEPDDSVDCHHIAASILRICATEVR